MHYHCEIHLKNLKDLENQIENILYPYSEHLEVERYSYNVDKDDINRFLNHYRKDRPEYSNLSFKELYQIFGNDWNNNDWTESNDGVWIEYSTWNKCSFYDFYQVGGRWTGEHEKFNPEDDPNNYELCWICGGTGFRNDETGMNTRKSNESYTCNGCGSFDEKSGKWSHGKYKQGYSLKWPTKWKHREKDIIPVSDIREDLSCFTLIVDGKVYHQEKWTGKEFIKTDFDGNVKNMLNKLGIKDGYLVTIDYHC
jgi:hypothetical protein